MRVYLLVSYSMNFSTQLSFDRVSHLHPRNIVVAEQGKNSLCWTHDVIVLYFSNKARLARGSSSTYYLQCLARSTITALNDSPETNNEQWESQNVFAIDISKNKISCQNIRVELRQLMHWTLVSRQTDQRASVLLANQIRFYIHVAQWRTLFIELIF